MPSGILPLGVAAYNIDAGVAFTLTLPADCRVMAGGVESRTQIIGERQLGGGAAANKMIAREGSNQRTETFARRTPLVRLDSWQAFY